MGDDDLLAEKDTSTDPSSSVKLGEVGGSSTRVAADYCITGKKVMDGDDILIEKDTSTEPSSSVKLDELGGNNSSVAAVTQNKTLNLENELQHLSLERKAKSSKARIKKPISVSQYKPEPWMLQGEDQEMPRQLNLAIVSNDLCITYLLLQCFSYKVFHCFHPVLPL